MDFFKKGVKIEVILEFFKKFKNIMDICIKIKGGKFDNFVSEKIKNNFSVFCIVFEKGI